MASSSTLKTILAAVDTNYMLPSDTKSMTSLVSDAYPANWIIRNFTEDVTYTMLSENMTTDIQTTMTSVGGTGDRFAALRQYTLFWVTYHLNHQYLNVISAIGIPGSILSIITILQMKPFNSPCIYVVTLAMSDCICLLVKLTLLQVTKNEVNVGDAGCQALFYLGNVFSIFSNWILVMMSVERYLAIWFPLRIGTLCTRRRSIMSICILCVFVCLLNTPYVITSEGYMVGDDFICKQSVEYEEFVEYTWYWVDGMFYFFIPCLLLIIFNSLIIVGIRKAAVIQRSLMQCDTATRRKSTSSQAAEKVRQQRQITVMLMVVCLAFIVLIMPNCVYFIYKPYWVRTTPYDEVQHLFVGQLIFMLSDLNHAVNFFIYFISTKKFRDRFVDTIRCYHQRVRHLTHPSQTVHSQLSDTGSIYVTSASNGSVIPMSQRITVRL